MDSKPKLYSIEKFVKSSNIPNERLASLKLPRDLNLGGTKPKKIYAPNLNVIRNKDKSREHLKKSESITNRRGNDRRNNHKQKEINPSRYVQSSGVFSEGTAEIKRSSQSYGGRVSNYSDRDSVASIVMPKLNRNSWNVNKTEEATIANDLMMCDEDDSSTDIEYEPVILPLDRNKDKFSKNFTIMDDEIKVKKEVNDDMSNTVPLLTNGKVHLNNKVNSQENSIDWAPACSFNLKRKFTDEENIMSLIRLPDSLPGRSFSDESEKVEDYTVDRLLEGQMGKIIVRRSGKMEVIIADTRYHLESEESSFFSEEVVMFPGKNSTSIEKNVISLGPLEEKFAITPKWDYLFEGKKT